MTLAEFRDASAAYISHLDVRAKGSTCALVRVHIRALVGIWDIPGPTGARPVDLTAVAIDRWIEECKLYREWKPPTINSYLRTLRAILLRIACFNPRIVMLRENRSLVSILDDDELDWLLLEAGPTGLDRLMLLMACDAGLRHQEIVHLTRGDLPSCPSSPEVKITAKAGWTTKSYQERAVPATKRLIRACLELQTIASDEWVFPLLGFSSAYPVPALYDRVVPLFVRAGLYDPDRRPGLHMLRRTWASNLLARGADLETVRQLGGWRSIEVVQRYLGTTSQRKRDAIALLDKEDSHE